MIRIASKVLFAGSTSGPVFKQANTPKYRNNGNHDLPTGGIVKLSHNRRDGGIKDREKDLTMSKANAFYAQSGGVTAVINASACGVIETARNHKDVIGKVFAGRNGILGCFKRRTHRYEQRVGQGNCGSAANAKRCVWVPVATN